MNWLFHSNPNTANGRSGFGVAAVIPQIYDVELVLQLTFNSMYIIFMYVAINLSMFDSVNNMEPSVLSW